MSELYNIPHAKNCGTSTGAGVTVPSMSTRTLGQIARHFAKCNSVERALPIEELEAIIIAALREAVADVEQKARAEYGEQLKPLFEKVRTLEGELAKANRALERIYPYAQ